MDIRALAQHLGLSIGTVSRALNGRKDVNPQTRARVVQAAEEYGYAPNQSGRALRRGRTGSIGFMLTLEHDSASHGDPFFMTLFEGIQTGLAAENLDLVVLLARDGEDRLDVLRRNVSRGMVDGWLLSATQHDDPRIPFLLDRQIPFVTLGRSASGAGAQPWIDLDFEGLVQQAMTHFISAGHRRIGIVAPPASVNNSYIVLETYRQQLTAAGIPYDPQLVHQGDAGELDGDAAAHELMATDQPPSALLVMGETAPVGVYRGLRDLGLVPGRDLAVIGARDNPATMSLQPGLTCFTLSLQDLGLALARALIQRISATPDITPTVTQLLWPMTLVKRESHHHLLTLGSSAEYSQLIASAP